MTVLISYIIIKMELTDYTRLDISKPRIAFYGITGAGKSSTLNTLMG
jgi:GTP-binding protein EngB required for normal cell division